MKKVFQKAELLSHWERAHNSSKIMSMKMLKDKGGWLNLHVMWARLNPISIFY